MNIKYFTDRNTTPQTHEPGSMLIEMTVALGLLVGIAMFLLIGSLDVIKPRNWTIIQNMTDSYLTYEEAYAKRIPFDDLADNSSAWRTTAQTTTNITIGKIYDGKEIKGTVKRILEEDPNNGNATNNPAQMETYTLYSVLTYKIGDKDYVKSRTIIRSR